LPISDALEAAEPGDTVQFGATEYAGTSVTVTKDVNMVGVCDAGDHPLTVLRPPGGARIMKVDPGVTVTVECIRLTGANANLGGAAILNEGDLTLARSEVVGNTSTHTEGGGGIRSVGEATVRIQNSEVTNNHATSGRGGGIYATGSGGESGLVLIEDSVVSGNSATFGGGIAVYGLLDGSGRPFGPLVTLLNSSVESNTTAGSGGGVHNQWARLVASNSVFTGNQSSMT